MVGGVFLYTDIVFLKALSMQSSPADKICWTMLGEKHAVLLPWKASGDEEQQEDGVGHAGDCPQSIG